MYTARQAEVLRLVQSGMSMADAGRQLGLDPVFARRLVARFRHANDLSVKEFWRILPALRLQMTMPAKKNANLRQRADGSWEANLRYKGKQYYIGSSPTKEGAYKKKLAAQADMEGFIATRSAGKTEHEYVYNVKPGVWVVRKWDNKRKVTVQVGTRYSLEDAIALRDEYIKGLHGTNTGVGK